MTGSDVSVRLDGSTRDAPDAPASTLVASLLAAIVRADGDALVMHVGERPYVVALSGVVDLSTRPLTLDSLRRLLAQLLPASALRTLDEVGAVEYELESTEDNGERYRLVAARGGDDIWTEIRRYRRDLTDDLQSTFDTEVPPATAEPAADDSGPMVDDGSAVVVPWQRPDRPLEPVARPGGDGRLNDLVRGAFARRASTLYLMARSQPMVRVDGEVTSLGDARPLEPFEIEAFVQELESDIPTLRPRSSTHDWVREVSGVGRIRCVRFHDHRGPGLICRLAPAQAASADELGLSKEVRSLVSWPDGLVLVTGHRLSGKSRLISALVDLINRTRNVHVVTLERQLGFVHENRGSLISQREVRGDAHDLAAALRATLAEDPDVVVVSDLRAGDVMAVALEAAESGRLVIGAFPAAGTVLAIERILEHLPTAHRTEYRRMLASTLRGAVAQVLIKKTGGGRLAARELLLNTPLVAALIADGRTHELSSALDSGRSVGMVPMNDALAAFVKSGATDAREAYRVASDREGLLAALRRLSIDTSFIERRA